MNINNNRKLIAIIAGNTSDKAVYDKTIKVLEENNIDYELKIISAHRDPNQLNE